MIAVERRISMQLQRIATTSAEGQQSLLAEMKAQEQPADHPPEDVHESIDITLIVVNATTTIPFIKNSRKEKLL